MKGLLIRVGVDHSYGGWNAPADPKSGRFVYVPIPDSVGKKYHPEHARRYEENLPALENFAAGLGLDLKTNLGFPRGLLKRFMHLDPDFQYLTYGDNGERRGTQLNNLQEGDLLVFYAGLRSVERNDQLIYALVGLYVVSEIIPARTVPKAYWKENAHTRWVRVSKKDVVVRGKPGLSGRLERAIPIGEWRDRAYRVRRDLLSTWGNLSVQNGYIQRSARPPSFLDAARFYRWFLKHDIQLVRRNN